jgi:hypothetical protein
MFHDSNVPQQGSASAQVLAYYNWLESVTPAQPVFCSTSAAKNTVVSWASQKIGVL